MRTILKLVVCPLLLVVQFFVVLGKLLTNVLSYVIGALFLLIAGCAVYCVVQALWMQLALLLGMGFAAFLVLFLLVWGIVKIECAAARLHQFLYS